MQPHLLESDLHLPRSEDLPRAVDIQIWPYWIEPRSRVVFCVVENVTMDTG